MSEPCLNSTMPGVRYFSIILDVSQPYKARWQLFAATQPYKAGGFLQAGYASRGDAVKAANRINPHMPVYRVWERGEHPPLRLS
jgi:hypothetical protein